MLKMFSVPQETEWFSTLDNNRYRTMLPKRREIEEMRAQEYSDSVFLTGGTFWTSAQRGRWSPSIS